MRIILPQLNRTQLEVEPGCDLLADLEQTWKKRPSDSRALFNFLKRQNIGPFAPTIGES